MHKSSFDEMTAETVSHRLVNRQKIVQILLFRPKNTKYLLVLAP